MPSSTSHVRRSGSSSALSRSAARLLAALAVPDTVATDDPSRDDHILLRGSQGTVSLGRGSYPRTGLAELIRLGLATRDVTGAASVSAPGRAWLARDRASRDGRSEDAFVSQHREIDEVELRTERGCEDVAINARESPLAWLRRRRGPDGEPLIGAAAYEAGERLRRDLTFAGMLPSVTARWDGAIGSGAGACRDPAAATDVVIAARQRVRAALTEVGGDFADLLVDLCGFLKGIEAIERERRWPPRSGKIVIRLALGQLARHYGLENEATGRERSRGIRSWMAATA